MSAKENTDFLMRSALDAGISDQAELANFMGQMQIESGGFIRMTENLSYSGKRLMAVFPGRNGMTSLEKANAIAAGGPESVANSIYGGAWGKRNLKNTESGDGWRFRGRGYVQLTGRANYERVGKMLGLDLLSRPESAAGQEVAARIAVSYWQSRVVPNSHQRDVKGATRDINGGYNHLAERTTAVLAWKKKIEQGYIEKNIPSTARAQKQEIRTASTDRRPVNRGSVARGILRQGARGAEVLAVQQQLNRLSYRDAAGRRLREDGDFGQRSRDAVQIFQKTHGLKADGVVGPQTIEALRKAEQG